MLALATMARVYESDPERATTLLQRAVKAHPNQPAPRLRLIEQLLANKKTKEALSVAENSVAALPDSYDLLDALGRVQQLDGGHGQAVATYAKLIPMRPASAHPYIRQAEAHVANGDAEHAAASLRKALEVEPNSVAALRGLVMMSLASKDLDGATEYAKRMQSAAPEGSRWLCRWPQRSPWRRSVLSVALSALREGLAKTSSSASRCQTARDADAGGSIGTRPRPWPGNGRRPTPNRPISRSTWATLRSGTKTLRLRRPPTPRWSAACPTTHWPATTSPGPCGDKARPAQSNMRSVQCSWSRNRTEFQDTLASILSSKGDLPRALAIQRKIVDSEPENTGYRLALAKSLLKAGEKADAKSPASATRQAG